MNSKKWTTLPKRVFSKEVKIENGLSRFENSKILAEIDFRISTGFDSTTTTTATTILSSIKNR